ncbi:MAG: hypothetical protein Q8M26_02490 [Pseudolabrys sp.]|nr:hypothetical protein [Pseudolabrys sp.]
MKTFAGSIALLAAAGLLAGCQTTSDAPRAGSPESRQQVAQAPQPDPEPPLTRARAAEQCWMATEKNHPGASVDRRADIVTKCIDDKLKAAAPAPRS